MNTKDTGRKVFFLIPTCIKYKDKTRAIQSTWAKQLEDFGFNYLFLMGKQELRQAKVEGNILYVPCKDDYESLLLKLTLGYEYLYHNMDFTYIYKIDDDCFPNLQKFQNDILPQLIDRKYFGGVVYPEGSKLNTKWHFGKCSDPAFDQQYPYEKVSFDYALGGFGYFLHKDILPILLQYKSILKAELEKFIYSYEDLRIGEILNKHKIYVSTLDQYSTIAASDYNGSSQYLVYDIQNPGLMPEIEKDIEDQKIPKRDSILNHYFDHIYVVNLKHNATDRLKISIHLSEYGVEFEIFQASNGFEGKILEQYKQYTQGKLGNLKRYAEHNKEEIERGSHWISSPGAMGYIHTYLRILSDAKKNNYRRFLILEDDILLSKDFESRFKYFIRAIDEDWKILLLGASQIGWKNIDISDAAKKGYYNPVSIAQYNFTYGSFAIAFDSSIIDELIEAESAFEAPFDHFPMGELYGRYPGKCFVAYPNIVMPDVTDSTIRGKTDQFSHSKKMKWQPENFDYPLKKPSISIVITSKNNLKYYSNFSKTKKLPFDLRLFSNSCDGLRPVHNAGLLDSKENKILPLNDQIFVPGSDYSVTIEKEKNLTENDIVKFIEYKQNIREKNKTSLKEMESHKRNIKKGRVSVIIPAYKRPKNLKKALESVISQDYHNIEVIVVSDNGKNSEFAKETRQLISSFNGQNANCNVLLLEHTVKKNVAAARNTGTMNSTGEYICFLDNDDIFLPERLSKSIEVLKTTNKTVGAVYCGYFGSGSQKNDLSRYRIGDLTPEILLLDQTKYYLCASTTTYKREAVLNNNGFDETYRHHQDIEFNLRFFGQFKIDAIKECLVQLNPASFDINNQPYDLKILELKQKYLRKLYDVLSEKNAELRKRQKIIEEKDSVIKERGKLYDVLSEKNAELRKRQNIIIEKDEELRRQQNMITEKNEAFDNLYQMSLSRKPWKLFKIIQRIKDMRKTK